MPVKGQNIFAAYEEEISCIEPSEKGVSRVLRCAAVTFREFKPQIDT